MAEEAKKDPAPAAADPAPEVKVAAKKEEKMVGKFINGDHMIHILFQKGKKFVPDCKDDR
jgi:hypothetical protein